MIVPLGTAASMRDSALVPEVKLLNFFLEKDESGISPDNILRIQRPGLQGVGVVGSGPIRGLYYRSADDTQIVVSGGRVYRAGADIGSIDGDGLVKLVETNLGMYAAGGGRFYEIGDTVTGIPIPEGRIVQDIDQINSYVIVGCTDGTFYWLVPGATAIEPLDFATAESLPDRLVAVCRVGDEFWLFGTDNTEIWQPTGLLDAPFQRVTGRTMERGAANRDTVVRFDNSVMWVTDDAQVCRGGAVPQVVSTPAIAEQIRRGGTTTAWTFALDGHEFYMLDIETSGTYAYDASTQVWSRFSSFGRRYWRPMAGQAHRGKVHAGDRETGMIYAVLAGLATEDGQSVVRTVTGTVPLIGRSGRNDSLSVGVGVSADCQIRVRWRDGQEDFPDQFEYLDARAPFDVVTLYRLGQPEQPYREIEVSCVDPVALRIAGCKANEGWR